MRLNLGSGNVYADGWTNVDHAACPHPRDETVDLTGPLPWPDATVEAVYAGHILEHLTLSQCLVLLHELRPAMVPGGQLMVVGPDLELAERFGVGTSHTLDELRHGGNRWPGDAHRWECTTATVVELLTAAGWCEVTNVGITEVPDSWPVADRRPPWQLAVSATAPKGAP